MNEHLRSAARWSAAGVLLVSAAYAAYVGAAWFLYGHVGQRTSYDDEDELLDQLMPVYEAGGRHNIRIAAPAAITLAAARDMDLLQSLVVRAIIRGRELILGATPDNRPRPCGLLAEMQALGWGVLAEIPDHEVVVGAVTQPWKPNVVFRALPASQFTAFSEPGFVKTVWTLRADPISSAESMFRTETRVVSTDAAARAKFRWYWSFFSLGMAVIRWASLAPLKAEAERRAGAARTTPARNDKTNLVDK